jgi:phospholipid/cholesterol/gamma-HCH transport system substrate-binding protein
MSDRRRREKFAEMAVGVLFFFGLLGLGYVTVLLSHRDLLGRQSAIRANFDSVGGLRRGDRVLVRGMEAGKVSRLKFYDGRVQVLLLFDQRPRIREDYKLNIRQSSVLGGRYVELDEGSPEAPLLSPGAVLEGAPTFDLVSDVEDMIGGIGDAMMWIRDALREGGLIENLSLAGTEIQKLVKDIREGEGSLGLLIRDPQLYERTVTAMDNIATFSEDLRNATGTLPRLIHDPSLYENAESLLVKLESFGTSLDTFASRLESVGSQVADSTGTLSRLINDPTLYDDLQATAANLRRFSDDMAAGKGSLGMMVTDDGELYASLTSALESLESVAGALGRGEGTIGKLMKEDELYEDIQSLVAELRAVVEDFREQTPVTTFSGVMLGAF